MHIPTQRIHNSLHEFLHQRFADAYASEEEGALAVAGLLAARDSITLSDEKAMYEQLASILGAALHDLSGNNAAPNVTKRLMALGQRISGLDLDRRREYVEAQEKELLAELEELIHVVSAEPGHGDGAPWRDLGFQIADWDFARINRVLSRPDAPPSEAEDTDITQDKLRDYLRSRFDDPDIEVLNFARGKGGFGKQTTFFETTGTLSGEFVLRRDLPVVMVDNDCHRVVNEYPVLKAVQEAGFPVPEVVWLETGHASVPGADFFVMRRVPGEVKGTVFGSSEMLSPDVTTTLAQTVGRLHTLEPLTSVGDLTESIRTDLWTLPVDEVVKRYITEFYNYYLRDRVSAVPSLAAVFEWLLANIPACDDRPTLVHGDLGLQNLLFSGDALEAVIDWEMTHIGDPMEDVAYIRNTTNNKLDWARFSEAYEAQSGLAIDPARVRFQQIWTQARNSTFCLMNADCYESGETQELKYAHLGFTYYSAWLGEAVRMIKETSTPVASQIT